MSIYGKCQEIVLLCTHQAIIVEFGKPLSVLCVEFDLQIAPSLSGIQY